MKTEMSRKYFKCAACGEKIYIGEDEAYHFGGEPYCSLYCLKKSDLIKDRKHSASSNDPAFGRAEIYTETSEHNPDCIDIPNPDTANINEMSFGLSVEDRIQTFHNLAYQLIDYAFKYNHAAQMLDNSLKGDDNE